MSNPIPRQEIAHALQEKGFRRAQGPRDHDYYCFYYRGKRTAARTKLSRGTGYREYDDRLFQLMRKSLCLNTTAQVRELLACPMNEARYIDLLRSSGTLRDE